MDTLNGWQCRKLTSGSDEGVFYSHSYYDVPVFDADNRLIAGHQVRFAERQPTPDDAIEIGYVDLDEGGRWSPVGTSRAWSWQQGAMAQWLADSRTLIWNDRDGDVFIARTYDVDDGSTDVLPRPVYALDPRGRFGLSLNMARLDHVRPGYGYVGGAGALMGERRPRQDGVWRVDLATHESELILSLREAVRFLFSQSTFKERVKHFLRRYVYWFNHVKISPDGERFTVKLRFRWRDFDKGWNDWMGVSLTCRTDGSDLRLLTEATSHVIWLDDERLYLWQRDGVYVYSDEEPRGVRRRQLLPEVIDHNVHIRHLPGTSDTFVFDTPYREDIDLFVADVQSGRREKITSFANHRPKRGLFRCDLHPCPSPDGSKIVVTSLEDGGRQLYLLDR